MRGFDKLTSNKLELTNRKDKLAFDVRKPNQFCQNSTKIQDKIYASGLLNRYRKTEDRKI